MEKKPQTEPAGPRGNPLVTLIIVAAIAALVVVLFLLSLAPLLGGQQAAYQPMPVLKATNPADEDAAAIIRLALESEDPTTVLGVVSRLPYLAVPQFKDGILALKERGLLWHYVSLLPELHFLGHEDAEEELASYIDASDLQMAMTALEALQRMPPLSCRDALLSALKQPHMDLQVESAKVIRAWRQSDPEINEQLLNIMNNAPVDFSQLAAAAALYDLDYHREEAWAKLRELTETADATLAHSLVPYLAECGDPRAPETIALLLDRKTTRPEALPGLVNLDWPGKEETLQPLTESEVRLERYYAVLALEDYRGKGELDTLVDGLLTPEPASEASEAAGDTPELGEEEADISTGQVSSLTTLLSCMKVWVSPRAIPLLERIARKGPRVVKMEVARVLRNFENNRRAAELARELLAGAEDQREARNYATTLGYIDSGRAVPRLHKLMLSEEDDETKLTFAWAILNINRGHPHKWRVSFSL